MYNINVYVCIYVCLFVFILVCMYVCMYIYIYVYIYVYVYIYITPLQKDPKQKGDYSVRGYRGVATDLGRRYALTSEGLRCGRL